MKDETAEVLNLSQTAVKARLWRARLQLRERLNKYFGQHPESVRTQMVPINRRTGKILGLFAECLNQSIYQTCSISLTKSPYASPMTALATKASQ